MIRSVKVLDPLMGKSSSNIQAFFTRGRQFTVLPDALGRMTFDACPSLARHRFAE